MYGPLDGAEPPEPYDGDEEGDYVMHNEARWKDEWRGLE